MGAHTQGYCLLASSIDVELMRVRLLESIPFASPCVILTRRLCTIQSVVNWEIVFPACAMS